MEKFYDLRTWGDNLTPGKELRIEHSLYFESGKADLSQLITLSVPEVEAKRKESAKQESAIFKKLVAATGEWETQASETLLLDKTLEYLRTPPVKHTANKWVKLDQGSSTTAYEISNMVYKMWHRIYERTEYDKVQKKSIPVAWEVSWSLVLNTPNQPNEYYSGNYNLAGQEKKVYKDKAAAEKYIQGRIAEYTDLFQEISPPIPEKGVWRFRVHGQLLPEYTTQSDHADELLSMLTEEDFKQTPKVPPTQEAPPALTPAPPKALTKPKAKAAKPHKKPPTLSR